MSKYYKENYRKIWSNYYGEIPKDKNGRTYDIHHKDGNKENNSIENLEALSITDHFLIHFNQGDIEACAAISLRMDNINFKGYTLSEETKKKLSDCKLGDKNPMKKSENAKKVSKALTGRKIPKEVTEKRLKSRLGFKHSLSTINKMKKPKSKIECPHCKKMGGISQMKRWHFNNCKQK